MRTIGLIGGMSWESTAVYYRQINEMVRTRVGGLASAKIAVQSLDFAEVVALQKSDRWDEAAALLADAAKRLEGAGADCVLICTNTMHLVADAVAASVNVPLIDIRHETGQPRHPAKSGPCFSRRATQWNTVFTPITCGTISI